MFHSSLHPKTCGIMIIFLQSKELRIVLHFISFITNWINVFSISKSGGMLDLLNNHIN